MIDPHVLFELSQWPVSTSRETQPEGETGYLGSKRESESKEKQETRRNKNEEEVTWKKEE